MTAAPKPVAIAPAKEAVVDDPSSPNETAKGTRSEKLKKSTNPDSNRATWRKFTGVEALVGAW